MFSYLVLIDRPIRGGDAEAELVELMQLPARLHVVVPARPLSTAEREFVQHERSESEGDVDEAVAAQWRLRDAITALHACGFGDVDGSISEPNPIDAIDAALNGGDFDAVVVVTGSAGISGWVHLDLPSRLERHVAVPVVPVEVNDRASV